ncbi:MAG: hypothetical protein COB09_18530 [Thalassobium sp.]|nr:MAG: hypothetical protein COB09_18530 [Thalassobium sp.]
MRQTVLFIKGMKLFTGKALRYAGKEYAIGVPFLYKNIAITPRKMEVMLRTRKLISEDELKARKQKASKSPVPVVEVEKGKKDKPSRRKKKKD